MRLGKKGTLIGWKTFEAADLSSRQSLIYSEELNPIVVAWNNIIAAARRARPFEASSRRGHFKPLTKVSTTPAVLLHLLAGEVCKELMVVLVLSASVSLPALIIFSGNDIAAPAVELDHGVEVTQEIIAQAMSLPVTDVAPSAPSNLRVVP